MTALHPFLEKLPDAVDGVDFVVEVAVSGTYYFIEPYFQSVVAANPLVEVDLASRLRIDGLELFYNLMGAMGLGGELG